jgi:hypothetical protein
MSSKNMSESPENSDNEIDEIIIDENGNYYY